MPANNQAENAAAARYEHLAAEVGGVVDMILVCTGRAQVECIFRPDLSGGVGVLSPIPALLFRKLSPRLSKRSEKPIVIASPCLR
jgi:hypothetical protein